MAVLHHHGGDTESRGGAQDGADIMGIGKLVQHQDDAAPPTGWSASRTSSRSRPDRGSQAPGRLPDGPPRGAEAGRWRRGPPVPPEPGPELFSKISAARAVRTARPSLRRGLARAACNGMKAIKPFSAAFGPSGRRRYWGAELSAAALLVERRSLRGAFRWRMARLIKKWGRGKAGSCQERQNSAIFAGSTPLTPRARLTNNPRSAAKPLEALFSLVRSYTGEARAPAGDWVQPVVPVGKLEMEGCPSG